MLNDKPAPYFYVDQDFQLEKLVEVVDSADRIAIDTEADSLYHFYEKVCLIQLSVADKHYIVDPLSNINLSDFLSKLAQKPLIIHGSDYDLRMLRNSFGFQPAEQVFDTMLAAQLLGFEKFGLAALVERFFGVTLSKQQQKSNWSQRPLSTELLAYASEDTRYLTPLADELYGQLKKLGRHKWHRQNCRQVVKNTATAKKDTTKDPWRIKGTSKLDPQILCFVREIWTWRQNQAKKADLPPFKIMPNHLIIQLAHWAVENPGTPLHQGPRLPRNFNNRNLKSLQHAIDKAQKCSPADWPREPKRKPRPKAVDYTAFFEALRSECFKIAESLDMDPAVLAPRAALMSIAKKRPQDAKGIMKAGSLLQWQAETIEPVVLRLSKNY